MTGPEAGDLAVVRRELGLGEHAAIQYDDDGWDSRVYLVNRGQAVFKFPRSPRTKHQYRCELAVLDTLQAIDSPVLVPRVDWRSPDMEWFGYRGIVGQQLSYLLHGLNPTTKRSIGAAIGTFLRRMHASRVDGLPRVPIDAEIAEYQKKYRLAASALDALTASEQSLAHSFFFEDLPSQMHRLGGQLCVTHGDLGPWNIILTDDLRVGVIDFGDVSYQDPSRDFAGFGDDIIFNAALESYDADDWLREKAWLRIKAFPILDIPFYLGKHDNMRVQARLELIRRLIVRGEVSAARPLHGS